MGALPPDVAGAFLCYQFSTPSSIIPLSANRRVVSILRQEFPEPVNLLNSIPLNFNYQEALSTNT